MLIIRESQKSILAHAMLRRWIVDGLREAHPDRTPDLAALAAHVDVALGHARARGHFSPDALWHYCRVDLLLGHGLETRPELAWARAVLDDPRVVVPGERLHALAASVTTEATP